MTRLARLAYALAAVIIVADQALKWFVVERMRLVMQGQSAPLLGPLRFTMVWNQGVSFGFLNFGAEWTRWLLSAFSAIVATVLVVWVRNQTRPVLGVAIGLIIGGAIGNLIDRVRLGHVTDFIDANGLYFPWVFNIADSAISIGSVLLIYDLFLTPKKATAA